MNKITPLFKTNVPSTQLAIDSARADVMITKDNLKVSWELYSFALDRYMATGLEAGLRKASDVQEWALLELATAQAVLDQLLGLKS